MHLEAAHLEGLRHGRHKFFHPLGSLALYLLVVCVCVSMFKVLPSTSFARTLPVCMYV